MQSTACVAKNKINEDLLERLQLHRLELTEANPARNVVTAILFSFILIIMRLQRICLKRY